MRRIFHDFHHEGISSIKHVRNRGLLPADDDALAEQVAAGFGPDVLTLQDQEHEAPASGGAITTTRPQTAYFAERAAGVRQRHKCIVAVRHASNDRVVAMIEVLSPGNKNSATAFNAVVHKARELMEQQIHLRLHDPLPPGVRDPNGIHAAIWEEYTNDVFELPAERPLTMVAYESTPTQRAYIETIAVGEPLPAMPLFLAPEYYAMVPLEATYQAAWNTVPARWQRAIAPEGA